MKLENLRKRIEILTGDDPGALPLPEMEKVYTDLYAYHKETFGPFDGNATREVSLWINNDETYYHEARRILNRSGLDAFMVALAATLNYADEKSTAWYVRKGLSLDDMDRIEWFEVACDLMGV
jgi:hypothetical protein